MLKFHVSFVYVFLTISGIVGERRNYNSQNITTANPLSNILNKFHQNDYKLTYEWSEIIRVDKRLGIFQKHTFKYNRTTTVVNLTFTLNVDMGYKVEVIAQAYKFASNEYRLFPIRFQFNLCEAITKQSMGLNKFATYGNFSCPILKGKRYHCYNWSPEEASFPPFIPTGRYMLEVQFMYLSNEICVTRDYGTVYRPFIYND